MRLEREIELEAAPEAVYDLLMDPSRLGDWVTIHRRLRVASAAPLRAGSEMVQSLQLAGVPFDVHWTIATARRPSGVVWEGRGPAHSHARIAFGLSATATGATRFAYANDFELPGGPLGRIATAVIAGTHIPDREIDESLARLRALLER